MKARWTLLQSRFDALNIRERALIAASLLAVLYVLWDLAFFAPQAKERQNLERQLAAQASELDAKNNELTVLSNLVSAGNQSPAKVKIQALEKTLGDLDKSLTTLSQGLIAASDLPMVLQDVLKGSKGLSLVSVKTLALESLDLALPETQEKEASAFNVANAKSEQAGVFKHTTAITLRGSYFDILSYLQNLEQLPWRFYWQQVQYTVDTYPEAEVEIQVYTLSAEEGLLGV